MGYGNIIESLSNYSNVQAQDVLNYMNEKYKASTNS